MHSRFAVVYSDGTRKMSIGTEMLANGFALHVKTIGCWEDDPSHALASIPQVPQRCAIPSVCCPLKVCRLSIRGRSIFQVEVGQIEVGV
jgi:hypothetical protein